MTFEVLSFVEAKALMNEGTEVVGTRCMRGNNFGGTQGEGREGDFPLWV